MNVSRNARCLAVALATLNWVIPASQVQALNPPGQNSSTAREGKGVPINDIALAAGGQLRGVVLNPHGQPTDTFRVTVVQDGLVQNGRRIDTMTPDKQGRFHFDGLHGGLFQVTAGHNTYVCRGWAVGTAPPIARDQLLIVPEGIVQRGQRPMSDLFLSDPVMVGLIVAAAIAIPIAVINSRKDSPPGS